MTCRMATWASTLKKIWDNFVVFVFVPTDLAFLITTGFLSALASDAVKSHPAFKITTIVVGSLSTAVCTANVIQDIICTLKNDTVLDAVRKRGPWGCFCTVFGWFCWINSTILFYMGVAGWDWKDAELAMIFVGMTTGIGGHFSTLAGRAASGKAEKKENGVIEIIRLDDLPLGGR